MSNFLFTNLFIFLLLGQASHGSETLQIKSLYTQIPGNTIFLTKNLQNANSLQYELGASSSATGAKSVLWLRNEQGLQIPINTAFEYLNIKISMSATSVQQQVVRDQLSSCLLLAATMKNGTGNFFRFSFTLAKAIPVSVNLNRTEILVKLQDGENEIKSIECGL